jgi:hypothetical protein
VVIEVGNREYVWACASEVPAAFYMEFVVLGIGNLIILNKKGDKVQSKKKDLSNQSLQLIRHKVGVCIGHFSQDRRGD